MMIIILKGNRYYIGFLNKIKGGLVIIDKKIKVLIVEPDKLPEERIIDNTLETKQKIVGGYIEYISTSMNEEVLLICNEEGKLNGMAPNRDIGYDIIFGPMIIIGEDSSGEDKSLTDEQIEFYKKKFDEKSIKETKEKIQKILNKNDLNREGGI